MNRLSSEKRQLIVSMLVEGSGINATSRMAGVSKNTVLKFLGDLGLVCSIYQDRMLRDLPCQRIQADEIWSFCYAKQKNVPPEKRGEAGDVWTWVALDPDTKLVPTFHIGSRDSVTATAFLLDLAKRMRNRIQLTTDGLDIYPLAVQTAFGRDIDYAMLIKQYANAANPRSPERRYSPSVCIGAEATPIRGNPDPAHVSTSHIERLNLGMRMSVRRYTRLTNAFSKKLENHAAAVSLHFFHYNFCRPHQTLEGKTPAMAAGVSDHVWTLQDLIGLLVDAESVPTRRGSYKPRKKTPISE